MVYFVNEVFLSFVQTHRLSKSVMIGFCEIDLVEILSQVRALEDSDVLHWTYLWLRSTFNA